jgi:hypothetical protein
MMRAHAQYVAAAIAILPESLGSPLDARGNNSMAYSFSKASDISCSREEMLTLTADCESIP